MKNVPLKSPARHPISGEFVKACKALIHPFTPTGIHPNRATRRQMQFGKPFRINNRKRTLSRRMKYQEVLLPIPQQQPMTLRKMLATGIRKAAALSSRFLDRTTAKYYTRTIQHYGVG